jgi:hypothetical protein
MHIFVLYIFLLLNVVFWLQLFLFSMKGAASKCIQIRPYIFVIQKVKRKGFIYTVTPKSAASIGIH